MRVFLAIVLFLAVGAAVPLLIAGVLVASELIPSVGSVAGVNVGVYSDAACTVNCTRIDWGTADPGCCVQRIAYVENTGNVAEVLGLDVRDWNPAAAASYLSVSWNLEDSVLAPGQVASATLTLKVSSSIVDITSFSNTLVVTGTEVQHS